MPKAALAILLMALVTYLTRVLPVTLFRKQIKSAFVRSFLRYVPYAVLGALTFPDILYSTGDVRTAAVGVVCALIPAFFGRSLVTVALCAIAGVLLAGIIL